MLRFNKITISNFGPYFGQHEIVLNPKDGVTFVWGNNGYGKTSFLNALRFALWGSLVNSKRASQPLADFVNKKAKAIGEGMMVRLDCKNEEHKFTLIRNFKRLPEAISDGNQDSDYEYSFIVKQDAQALTVEEAIDFQRTMFPDNISRFYLFDAELLDQYEKLVEENNNDNEALKQDIEDLLGLPILDGAKHSLMEIAQQLQSTYDRVSKEDQKNEKNNKTLKNLNAKKENVEKEIGDLEAHLQTLKSEIENCEIILSENEQFNDLLNQETKIKSSLEEKNKNLEEAQEKLKKSLGLLWEVVFDKTLSIIIDSKVEQENALIKETGESKAQHLISEILNVMKENHVESCPICSAPLSAESIEQLFRDMETHMQQSQKTTLQLNSLRAEISKLRSYISHHSLDGIVEDINAFLGKKDEIQKFELDLSDITERKNTLHKSVSADNLREVATKYGSLSSEYEAGKKGLKDAKTQLQELKTKIANLRKEISANGGEAVKKVTSQQELIETLQSIIEDGMTEFREDLKKRIEKTASRIFCSISHNKDYIGLRINDHYGLEILEDDGEIVPNRSEGFEQVVAFSLVAALHLNSPIAGPIIMDSTFQRIDLLHKSNTLRCLPTLGRQIIVLAYQGEVNRQEAVQILGESYLKDYAIKRIDKHHSQIEKYYDGFGD